MSDDVVISCRNLSKRFRIPNAQYSTLKGRVVRPFARTTYTEFRALQDVSFEVRRGEFFGIVGRNGSGKSTLLKTIAGIYRADSGRLEIDGAIAPFIELGVGFNDELNGRENLFLNGALLGLSRDELERRYDAIVEFAELQEFMELKLRNFSSGMQVRLAFSIALQAGADILLTDEVLAVGDERFQRKCFDVFRAQKRQGQTVIFVSHDMGAISQFCDRALMLERGEVVAVGPVHEVVREYHRINTEDEPTIDDAVGTEILEVWIEDLAGTRDAAIPIGETAVVAIRFSIGDDMQDPIVGLSIRDRFGTKLVGSNSDLAGVKFGMAKGGTEHEARFEVPIHMARGSYAVSANIAWPTPGDIRAWVPQGCDVVVEGGGEQVGVIEIPHTCSFRQDVGTRASAPQLAVDAAHET